MKWKNEPKDSKLKAFPSSPKPSFIFPLFLVETSWMFIPSYRGNHTCISHSRFWLHDCLRIHWRMIHGQGSLISRYVNFAFDVLKPQKESIHQPNYISERNEYKRAENVQVITLVCWVRAWICCKAAVTLPEFPWTNWLSQKDKPIDIKLATHIKY